MQRVETVEWERGITFLTANTIGWQTVGSPPIPQSPQSPLLNNKGIKVSIERFGNE